MTLSLGGLRPERRIFAMSRLADDLGMSDQIFPLWVLRRSTADRVCLVSQGPGVSVARYLLEGVAGRSDRSHRPHWCPHRSSGRGRGAGDRGCGGSIRGARRWKAEVSGLASSGITRLICPELSGQRICG